jgi:hypothetical protein
METINEQLYEFTSKETGVDITQVKDIIKQQSVFTKHIIEVGAFESVIYPYLGKMKAKLKKVQQMNHFKGVSR